MSNSKRRRRFSLGLKIAVTLYVAAVIPLYWKEEGPGHFLWFCDLALLLAVPALWRESPLLASMMALGTLPFLAVWNVDFFAMLAGVGFGLTGYMLNPGLSLQIRVFSLFHVWLVWIWLLMLYRLGYDRRAWAAQSLLALIVMPLSYWASHYAVYEPIENINWSLGPLNKPQSALPPMLYLALATLATPTLIYAPAHLILKRLFPSPAELREKELREAELQDADEERPASP
jgi:CDP-diglyceride synthetase